MTPILATWSDGFFTLGMMAVAYGAACAIAEILTRAARWIFCGRRACSWCKTDLGRAPGIRHGSVTHTICPTCKAAMLGDLNLTGNPKKPGEEGIRSFGISRVPTAGTVGTSGSRS